MAPANPYAPPGQPGYAHPSYPCVACGHPGADHFVRPSGPMHRACAGLGPDVLAWPWLLLAYSVVVPFGCTLLGALLASIPYYVWKTNYPLRAKAYNRHVWIGFGISSLLWLGWSALSATLR